MTDPTSLPPRPATPLHDFVDHAPCGLLLTEPDGRILFANNTFGRWLGYDPTDLVDRRFSDLLTVGSRIHYETHFAPLLQMTGSLSGIAAEFLTTERVKLPVFITANVACGTDGRPSALRITVQDASERRSYEKELLEARRAADRERERAQVLATTLQRSLVPPSLFPPDGLLAAAHYHTASRDDVGGDFYDLFPMTPQTWGIFLGDVSGKGAAAAAVTSLTRYTLRAAAVNEDDPVAVLRTLDSVLRHEFHSDDPRFCTVIFGVIRASGRGFDLELAAGGHPPALLLPAHGQAHYVPTTGGQAVGLLKNPRFVSARVHLGAGDTLVMYTDGLTEARTGRDRRFDDYNELLDFAQSHTPTTATAIVSATRELLESFGEGLEDDTAVLAVSVAPVGRPDEP